MFPCYKLCSLFFFMKMCVFACPLVEKEHFTYQCLQYVEQWSSIFLFFFSHLNFHTFVALQVQNMTHITCHIIFFHEISITYKVDTCLPLALASLLSYTDLLKIIMIWHCLLGASHCHKGLIFWRGKHSPKQTMEDYFGGLRCWRHVNWKCEIQRRTKWIWLKSSASWLLICFKKLNVFSKCWTDIENSGCNLYIARCAHFV